MSKKTASGAQQGLKLAVVIMAAGKGTRLKSRRPKVLHQVGGKPLLQHVIAAAGRVVEPAHIFAVVGHQAERVEKAMAESGIRFVVQAEQRGTGHAIQCAMESVGAYDNILVLSGDVPLIRTETIEQLWNFHLAQDAAMTLLTAMPENPAGYGRVVRRDAQSAEVEAIVEQKMLTPEQQSIREINAGVYAFKTAALKTHLQKLAATNAQAELYLTDLAELLRAAGERVWP